MIPFPRGSTTGGAGKGIAESPRDELQESLFGKKRTRTIEVIKAKKKKVEDTASMVPSIGLGMAKTALNNKIVKVESLRFMQYQQGSLALGLVLQVADSSVIVSLPGGLTGSVAAREISDVLYKLSASENGGRRGGPNQSTPHIGSMVRQFMPVYCYVLENGKDKKSSGGDARHKMLNLSMRSSLVNRGISIKHLRSGFPVNGCIESVEDHGYVVATGIRGCIFFLPFAKMEKSDTTALIVGQPISCVVESVSDAAQSVTLRAHNLAVRTCVASGSALAFTALVPGMLLEVMVDKQVQNGLVVQFLNSFYGVIDDLSLPRAACSAKLWQGDERLSEGSILKARIVFIDYATKSVRLSLRPHVLELRVVKNLPALGDVLSDLTVTTTSKRVGVYAAHYSDSDITAAGNVEDGSVKKKARRAAEALQRERDEAMLGLLIHKSSLASRPTRSGRLTPEEDNDKEDEEDNAADGDDGRPIDPVLIEKRYHVGDSVRCARAVGYNLVEGLVVASNLTADLRNEIVHWSRVTAGSVLPVVVSSVNDFGLVVKINDKIRAVCPTQHLADSTISLTHKLIQKRFRLGQKLPMRVWEVKGNSIIMTNKKSLVDDDGAIVTSYEEAQVGAEATGIVSFVSSTGLRVHFYNNVRGFVSSSVLQKQGVSDPCDAYRQGQVVKCVILKVVLAAEEEIGTAEHGVDIDDVSLRSKIRRSKLVLALSIGSAAEVADLFKAELSSSRIHGDPQEPSDSNPDARFVSGTISKKDEYGFFVDLEDGRRGYLHRYHTCDFVGTCDVACRRFAIGTVITDALVLTVVKNIVQLSLKPLLVGSFRQGEVDDALLPSKSTDLVAGRVLVGFVHKVEAFGVLIKFLDHLTALAPRPNVADKFVVDPAGMFTVGDAVRCLVQRVDLAKERVIVTLKPAFVPPSSGLLCFAQALLRERQQISSSKNSDFLWSRFSIGDTVAATVSSIKDYGIVLMGENDAVTVLLARDLHADRTVAVGSSVSVRVLDIDFESNVVDVSMDKELTASAKKRKKSHTFDVDGTSSLSQGSSVHCRVELVKDKYAIASVGSGAALVVLMLADYHSPYLSSSEVAGVALRAELLCLVQKAPAVSTTLSVPSFPHERLAVVAISDERRSVGRPSSVMVGASDAEELGKNFINNLRVGKVFRWEVKEVTPLELSVVPENHRQMKIAPKLRVIVHISVAVDHHDASDNLENALAVSKAGKFARSAPLSHDLHPFRRIKPGDVVSGRVLQVRQDSSSEGEIIQAYVSILSRQAAEPIQSGGDADTEQRWAKMVQWKGAGLIKDGHAYTAVITQIERFGCKVSISPYIATSLSFLDVSSDKRIVRAFAAHCFVGQRLVLLVRRIEMEGRHTAALTVTRASIEQFLADDLTIESLNDIILLDEPGPLKAGQQVWGQLDTSMKPQRPPAVTVRLAHGMRGRVCATEMSDPATWTDMSRFITSEDQAEANADLPNGRKNGEFVRCRVLEVAPTSGSSGRSQYELTMRLSRLTCKNKREAIVPDPIPEPGSLVRAFVANVSTKGCFLRISSSVTALCRIKDLSDDFLEDPAAEFPVGKLVHARVLAANASDNTVRVSLKISDVVGDEKGKVELSSLAIGDTVVGTIQKVADFGVFVAINGTSLVGLSRRNFAVADESVELKDVYEVGSVVRAKVLSVSSVTRKIGLGLKPSYFRNDEEDSYDDEQLKADEDTDSENTADDDDDSKVVDENDEDAGDDSEEDDDHGDKYDGGEETFGDGDDLVNSSIRLLDDEEEEDSDDDELKALIKSATLLDDDEEDSAVAKVKEPKAPVRFNREEEDERGDEGDEEDGVPSLRVSNTRDHAFGKNPLQASGLVEWGEDFAPKLGLRNVSLDDDDDESDLEIGGASKKSRHKDAEKRKAEDRIRLREAALSSDEMVPETTTDFERLLLGAPNSSALWIQYMAFHMQMADIEAARSVAERALRNINFREEDEKYNVWMALLTLEHKYGDQESLENAFRRAVAESRGKVIHLNMAQLYEKAGNANAAIAMYERTLKKFKYSKKVWGAYQLFLLRRGDNTGAKALLARSLQSLSRHKHVEVIEKYALAEFDEGSVDRARVLMEELLANYPKRTDLWHVYVDKEVKLGHFDQARRLFERMITTKVSTHNMKTIFKKYLAFEVAHGSAAQQEIVKSKARDYVNSLM